METITSRFKEEGIDGVYECIQDRLYERYESDYDDETENDVNWLIELETFISEHDGAFYYYPQTIMNALYHSSLLKYPEINEWFEELKKENTSKPIELLWDSPEKLNSYFIRWGHDDLIQGLVNIGEHRFATSSEDGFLKIWAYDPSDWNEFELKMEDEIEAHGGKPVNDLAYHPAQKWIASCGDDHVARVWNSETLEMVAEFTGHTDYVSCVLFQDELLFSGSKDKRIGVWDLNTLENVTFLEGHTDWVTTLTISPDKKRLFSVSTNNQLIEWDVENFSLKQIANQGKKNYYLDIPGEDVFISANNSDNRGHKYYPRCAEWTSDHKLYTSENEVIIWDSENWEILRNLAPDINPINCFIIHESFLITFSKIIKVYNIDTCQLIKEYPNVDGRNIKTAVLSEDKQYFICCDERGFITIWDYNTLMYREYSSGQGSTIFSLEVFYKDENDHTGVAVSGGSVLEAGIWDLKTGRMVRKIKRPKEIEGSEMHITKLPEYSGHVVMMYQKKICLQSPFDPSEKQELELPNDLFHPEIALSTKKGIIFGSLSYLPYYVNLTNSTVHVFNNKYSYNDITVSPDKKYALALTYPQSFDRNGKPFENPWKPISSPLVLIDLEKEAQEGAFWCSPLWSWIKIHAKWEKKLEKLYDLTYPCAAAWSGDSQYFAAAFSNGQIIIWNAKTRKRVKKVKLPDKNAISYIAWQQNDLLSIMINKKAEILQIDPRSGKTLKSTVIQGNGVSFKASHQQGRYFIWTSGEIVGIFDALKFEMIWVMVAKVKPRSILIERSQLLIGGEDGFLYGYDIEGVLE